MISPVFRGPENQESVEEDVRLDGGKQARSQLRPPSQTDKHRDEFNQKGLCDRGRCIRAALLGQLGYSLGHQREFC